VVKLDNLTTKDKQQWEKVMDKWGNKPDFEAIASINSALFIDIPYLF